MISTAFFFASSSRRCDTFFSGFITVRDVLPIAVWLSSDTAVPLTFVVEAKQVQLIVVEVHAA